MKKRILSGLLHILWMLPPVLTLTSCGEFLDYIGGEELDEAAKVILTQHEVDIQLGEEMMLEAQITPDSAYLNLFWFVRPSEPLQIIGRRLYTCREGDAMVYVKALTGSELANDTITEASIVDSCLVHVFDWHTAATSQKGYDMVLYCQLEIDGQDILQQGDAELTDNYSIAAHIDGSLAGTAQVVTNYGKPFYLLRIWSDTPAPRPISLQCYSSSHLRRIELSPSLTFDGETHGSLSSPIVLKGSFK